MNDTGALVLVLAARGGKEARLSARGDTRAAAESTLTPSFFFSAGSSALLRSWLCAFRVWMASDRS